MSTPIVYCPLCRKYCLAHELAQMRNRWLTADAFESQYLLSIEPLTRHDTFCPDCRALFTLLITEARRAE
jgi:ribosomal protein L44E